MCTLLACQLVDTRMIRVGCKSESVRAMGEGGRRERERKLERRKERKWVVKEKEDRKRGERDMGEGRGEKGTWEKEEGRKRRGRR